MQDLRVADVKDHELAAKAEELAELVAALAAHPELSSEHASALATLTDVRKRDAAREQLDAAVQTASALPHDHTGVQDCMQVQSVAAPYRHVCMPACQCSSSATGHIGCHCVCHSVIRV